MKRFKTFVAILGMMGMTVSLATGCGGNTNTPAASNNGTEQTAQADGVSEQKTDDATPKEIKQFTFYIAMPGTEIPDDNRMYNKIGEKIGAKAKTTWLTGQTTKESIGTMIAGGEYTDFIVGNEGTSLLINAGALVAIDEYWDNYPNIKNYLSESQWNRCRAEDGHIYLIPEFGIMNGKDTQCYYNDEAFWIQIRVLEWAGWPEIKTVDEYFKVISDYLAANPTMDDGLENIGFELLCDDWRYYSLENPPMFLAGYPNDGCCIVDKETLTAHNYNTTDTAKEYFGKINEQYKAGILDPECFTLGYDQFIAKISTGRVCGMVEQYWDFLTAEQSLVTQGLDDCLYVPLPLVMDESVTPNWHMQPAFDTSNGISITTSCKDVEGALQMINDMLSQEVQTMVFWGEEGVDYQKGEDGLFTRNDEQRANFLDKDWLTKNMADGIYSYFPHYEGMNLDGINAYKPEFQPSEYYAAQPKGRQKALDAYKKGTFMDFMDPAEEENDPWYPMWSYTNTWTADTEYGIQKVYMDEVKHEYLPKIIMADDYEAAWQDYMNVLNERVDMKCYEDALTAEVQRRVAVANGEATN